ncbi:MAG TPA: prolyl oligopeptidase family serine peptidase, partial [Candidatus Acidoferrum sp.]|nr:prolyl oligopeptidase family serine peptidase [Candidatus Acidoferrum sp.]
MKAMFIFLAAMHLCLAAVAATNTRVPPAGLRIGDVDHEELSAGVAQLGKEIQALRVELASRPPLLELLPDVQIFHKAVDWPLRYDEFYRSNEVAVARNLLKQGMERAQQLRSGKAPWITATGLVVRGYVSKIDGSVEPYGLVVPANFEPTMHTPCRLDVWLHGRDNNLTELKFIADRQRSFGEFSPARAFVLHPYGRYCNAFKFAGEIDVFEALEHVKKSYPIDSSRLAMRGFSMGGAGAWHLAAHHPDVWAAAAPGAGFSETEDYTGALTKGTKLSTWEQKLWQLYDATDYAANFFNLPVVAYNGTDDKQRQAADMMEKAMRAEGLTLTRVWGTNVGHKYTPESKREISKFVDDAIERGKEASPNEVRFTTRTLRFNRAPGVEVLGLQQHWLRADVIVTETDQRLEIATTNVTEFKIARAVKAALRDVRVNGEPVRATARTEADRAIVHLLRQRDDSWIDGSVPAARSTTLRKVPQLQGPIDDAFMDSFLIVRPTGKPQNEKVRAWISTRLAKATNEWRAQFRGDARVKDDVDVSDADIAAHNLILFG